MDNPMIDDDEVIADSEGEMDQEGDFYPQLGNGVLGNAGLNRTSSVSAFTMTGHPQGRPFSAISTFTGNPSGIQDHPYRLGSFENPGTVKEKDKAADTSISSAVGAFTDFEGVSGTISIADRAKMRQRTQKQPVSVVIELTSDEDDELSLKPSTSKAKSKAKPKPKAKEKPTEKVSNSSNVADPPSESRPKPRPRPRPIAKHPMPTHDGIGLISSSGAATPAPYPPTSTPPPPSHGPDIPVATSPPMPMAQLQRNPHFPNNAQFVSSQLPPSDSPIPSLTTAYHEDEYDNGIPRIETLPNAGAGGQLSSPSSLGASTRKRKRMPLDVDVEVDELATSPGRADNLDFPNRPGYISPRKMPPPPTFFAGSSSSPVGEGRGTAMPDPNPEPEVGLQHDVVDLTMLPPTINPGAAKKAVAKPKKPRKKKISEEDKDMVAPPMIVFDEDAQDEDFNPTGDGEKKKKKKPQAKAKDKTPAKSKGESNSKDVVDTFGKGKVEVVITTKPKSKNKAPLKGKGKEKEGNKEIFKSAEFIEDSDEEADPMRLVGGVAIAQTPTTSSTTSKPKESVKNSASSSTSSAAAASALAHSKTDHRTDAPSSNPNLDPDMPKATSTTSKGAGGGNKRKNILDSDGDNPPGEEEGEIHVTRAPTTSKKRKTGDREKKDKPKTKNKGKNVVLSDDDEEDAYKVDQEEDEDGQTKESGKKKDKDARKEPKKAKSSKKIIPDEEEEETGDVPDNIQEQQPTPEGITDLTKENVVPPPSKPVMATPKHPTSNTPATNRDGSTPMYARYEIAPRKSSLPMSELIRRANSMPGSPFPTPHSSSSSKLKPLTARTPTATAYSPYMKSSRSLLSRIAPLHPNRRTPPPPPPPPPPRKKTKKELELEEKWEEEMVESVGGMEAWAVLPDEERREMRKMKWARELGEWDD